MLAFRPYVKRLFDFICSLNLYRNWWAYRQKLERESEGDKGRKKTKVSVFCIFEFQTIS